LDRSDLNTSVLTMIQETTTLRRHLREFRGIR
jgi:hypothetical protein